jgi:shikimate kinase
MILKLKRTPGIYLVGFMGCGKTTIGRLLAKKIGWHFFDIDTDIEKTHGGTVQEIFSKQGEAHFRELEHRALKARVGDIERGKPSVLALGGGAFVQPDNYALLENNGVTLFLDAPFELIQRRVPADGSRPLAMNPAKFRELFDARRSLYQLADHQIPIVDEDPEINVNSIMALKLFGI